ncbi:hypothetical protein KXJ69_06275 [Aureisphaera sp. CAU 1614]|uniref:UDP-glycosyltransferase n=1 Tax=Halomarinibacterium sedimenti TaxID=2857106 RepID=A0A9X1FN94_9FLAO|nr:hypothetical protein [Halomarinibacterium sedimenti]MBW2937705.1 hypothetical protein [Halomarinibacterium sedimenti]
MKENRTILFVIPDGVGIRNYLYSSIITHIKSTAQIHFWTTLPETAVKEVEKLHSVDIGYTHFTLPKESLRTRLFREASTYARLLHNSKILKNNTIIENWNKVSSSLKLKVLYFISEVIGKQASKKYKNILRLEEKSKKYWDKNLVNYYKSQLKLLKPTTIFITHQRVAFLNAICIAAKELGIKVICTIYSWDNTPKASLAIKTDKYLVWSYYMKRELSALYPEIPEDSIVVTGTPQFEFYLESQRQISRADFAQKYQLNEHQKWICFSGDDEKTSPFDPKYLEDVAEAVNAIPEKDRPQIIFRRCPVDVTDRYNYVFQKYSNIITPISPVWNTDAKSWGAVYPKMEDINLLVNIAFHCEFVINVGSTMAHDFAVYNKPCFYINYNQNSTSIWSVEKIYNFQHFRSMGQLDAVGWFNSKAEIKEKILLAISNPEKIAKDKQAWMRLIVNHPLDDNAKLITKELLDD